MSDPDSPLGSRIVPGSEQMSLEPGGVALRLGTEHSHEGFFDGAWWPRSRDVATELPVLVGALTERLGPVTRVGLDSDAWDGAHKPLFFQGRLVHIDWFPVGDDTIIVTRGEQDHFLLLAIPPHATRTEAEAALNKALRTDNAETGTQILLATGITEDD